MVAVAYRRGRLREILIVARVAATTQTRLRTGSNWS